MIGYSKILDGMKNGGTNFLRKMND